MAQLLDSNLFSLVKVSGKVKGILCVTTLLDVVCSPLPLWVALLYVLVSLFSGLLCDSSSINLV